MEAVIVTLVTVNIAFTGLLATMVVRLDGRVDALEARVDARFDALNARIDTVLAELVGLSERVARLESRA